MSFIDGAPDDEIWDMIDVFREADKTADSPTVFTIWHHYAEALRAAGYRKVEGVPVRKSCPTRLMDGRNEIRCWLDADHEGDCK